MVCFLVPVYRQRRWQPQWWSEIYSKSYGNYRCLCLTDTYPLWPFFYIPSLTSCFLICVGLPGISVSSSCFSWETQHHFCLVDHPTLDSEPSIRQHLTVFTQNPKYNIKTWGEQESWIPITSQIKARHKTQSKLTMWVPFTKVQCIKRNSSGPFRLWKSYLSSLSFRFLTKECYCYPWPSRLCWPWKNTWGSI